MTVIDSMIGALVCFDGCQVIILGTALAGAAMVVNTLMVGPLQIRSTFEDKKKRVTSARQATRYSLSHF
jgi:hypothetical protein